MTLRSEILSSGGGGLPAITDPTDIPNCIGWYRSDLGVTQSAGRVTTWEDQSGQGMDDLVAAGGISVGPTFVSNYSGAASKPAFYFDGVTQEGMQHTASWDLGYVVVVASQEHTTPFSNFWGLLNARTTGFILLAGNGTNELYDSGLVPDDVWADTRHGLNIDYDTDVFCFHALSKDGATTVSGLTLGRDRAQVARAWKGHVVEVMIFDVVPTDEERYQISNYVDSRYG